MNEEFSSSIEVGLVRRIIPDRKKPWADSHLQIIKKLGSRIDTRYKQMISSASTCDVKKVPFHVVDLFKVRVVDNHLDSLLQRDNFIVTRHDDNRTKFQTLNKLHGGNTNMAACCSGAFVDNVVSQSGIFDGYLRPL